MKSIMITLDIKTKYLVKDIIAELRKFRDAHELDYFAAREVYINDMTKKLNEQLNKIVNKTDPDSIYDNFGLKAPENEVNSYNNLIRTFSLMQTEEIELEFDDANRIFNDEWSWIASAKVVNSSYTSRR